MNCQTALEALLEADPAELTAAGESEVALHVRVCSRCGRVARELAGTGRALARDLDALPPALGPDQAVRLARAGMAQAAARRRRRRAALATLVPLAAAAVIAWLLLVRRTAVPPGARDLALDAPRAEAAGPSAGAPALSAGAARPRGPAPLRVESDRRFAVIGTRDPNITVVWFFN